MKFKFELGDLIKIPNILCYLRILMVPLFLHIYFTAERPQDFYLATLVVMLSGLTDFFDGQIARRCNMITDLGRIIDPLADKLMQLAMLIALTVRVKYMYLLVIFLVLKEVISAVTGFFVMKFAKKRLNGAKWYGTCRISSDGGSCSGYSSSCMCRSTYACICNVCKTIHYNDC